jgi:hypothetical protein
MVNVEAALPEFVDPVGEQAVKMRATTATRAAANPLVFFTDRPFKLFHQVKFMFI